MMMNLKTYGYMETQPVPEGLIPGRVTKLRRETFTVMTERGEVTIIPSKQAKKNGGKK